MRIFIDESGNNGDVTVSSINEQPFFTLCGVSISSEIESEFVKIVNSFRQRKNLQQLELKSSNTYNSNKSFTNAILDLLLDSKAAIFAETTDKRYSLCANIVSCTLLPSSGSYSPSEWRYIKFTSNKLADYLYYNLQDYHLNAYINTYKFPTLENFQLLVELLKKASLDCDSELNEMLKDAFDKLYMASEGNAASIDSYLPIPDKLKSGKTSWLLPYIPSFGNMYARINKFLAINAIDKINIFHDEQRQYKELIEKYKSILEAHTTSNGFESIATHASFLFSVSHPLEFVNSKTEIGIQIADMLAGFINRTAYQQLHGSIPYEYMKTFYALNKHGTPPTGINYLIPEDQMHRLADWN